MPAIRKLSFAAKFFSSVLVSSFALQAQAAQVTVQFKAYIEGGSYLNIQGDKVWWVQEEGYAPGIGEYSSLFDTRLPTIVNGHEWMPDWSQLMPYSWWLGPCVPTTSYSCQSDRVSGLLPALAATAHTVQLTSISTRAPMWVYNPTAENGYTTIVEFFDVYHPGGAWYDFKLTYETSEVPVPAAAWLFGSALAGLAGFGRRLKKD